MGETPIWRRYLRLLGSDPAADVEDELAFHLEMRVEELVRSGVPAEEARARAERDFGDVEGIRGDLRAIGRDRLRRERRRERWGSLRQDVRFAARTLRRSPWFATAAVLTLAVGIGAATSMFSVLHGVLLRELPVRDQDRLMVVWMTAPTRAAEHLPVYYEALDGFREHTRSFESVAGVSFYGAGEHALRDGDRTVSLSGTWVTGDLFPVLGVRPVYGRTLLPEDDRPGAAPVMVVGHGFWQRHFGGDPAAVGRTLEWNGKHYRVVGVLPRGFDFPRGAEFWVPVLPEFPGTLEADASPAEVMIFEMVGRLRPGITPAQAREEYAAYLRTSGVETGATTEELRPAITPLPELLTRDARGTLWLATAAVALLLLIACVNVANLLLIRGAARTQELAVRSALGAGRRRLVRQLLTESAVISLAGGVLGALLAFGAVRLLTRFAPPELPRLESIAVDLRVLGFALAVTAVAALASGLLPALLSAAGDLGQRLRGGYRTASASRDSRRLQQGLVIGQVALALVVIVSAGLLARSLLALRSVDLGFGEEQLLVYRTSLPSEAAPDRPRQLALRQEMLERVTSLPGVDAATLLPARPFSERGGWDAMITGEGQTPAEQETNPWVNLESVGPEYFRTLEIPIRRGRAFGPEDREGAALVAIVSESVARHTWPGEDPIGKRIKLGPPDGPGEWHTIVGIVGDTRYRDLTVARPSVYKPTAQFGPMPTGLAIRARANPTLIEPQIRQALQEVHPDWLVVGGGTVRQLMEQPLARPRFSTLLIGTFAAVTLLLAAVGVYGVMAASVQNRTREMGVRLALGAHVNDVRRLVLGQGLRLALLGSLIGIAAALLGTRALGGLLYEVRPWDPSTFAAVGALVLATVTLATYVPARRASRVDPAEAIRSSSE